MIFSVAPAIQVSVRFTSFLIEPHCLYHLTARPMNLAVCLFLTECVLALGAPSVSSVLDKASTSSGHMESFDRCRLEPCHRQNGRTKAHPP